MKDEYLSGNVRKKLTDAQEAVAHNPEFTENIEALLQVQPEDIPAEEIDVKIGSIWVPPEDYKQFILETLQLKGVDRVRLSVDYSQPVSYTHLLTFEHTIPMTEEKSIEFAKALNRYNLSTGSLVYINGTEFEISEFGAECHLRCV